MALGKLQTRAKVVSCDINNYLKEHFELGKQTLHQNVP